MLEELQEIPEENKIIVDDGSSSYDDDDMFRRVANIETDDGDGMRYGKKVQKRIDKLVAERNKDREAREKLEREIAVLKSSTGANYSEADVSDINAKIEQLKAEKRKFGDVLGDDYDFERAEEINEALIELQLQHREATKSKAAAESHPVQQQNEQIPDALLDWQERNGWVHRPDKNADKLAKADAIYNDLIKNGYAKDDEETYLELDKRLSGQPEKPTQKRREVAESNVIDRGSQSAGQETKGFTKEDFSTVKSWGLNPNDPAVRAEYMRNKG